MHREEKCELLKQSRKNLFFYAYSRFEPIMGEIGEPSCDVNNKNQINIPLITDLFWTQIGKPLLMEKIN